MPLFGPSQFASAKEHKQVQRKNALDKATELISKVPISPEEEIILTTPAWELAQQIKAGRWSSVTVVGAYARRCLTAQNECNCLTEVNIVEALERAEKLDDYQKSHSTTVGPLHGIPFTLKDTFAVEGYDCSLGISTFANRPYKTSSALYSTLTQLGAVLIAKTNVPQTLLTFECNNPIFGETHNPIVTGFTCGGSSGGEGVVLARNASAIGFGSDIGGSLRIPAAWCGIYSLKPTRGRFTTRGHHALGPGFEAIPTVTGPMGRNIEDLVFFMKILLAEDLTNIDAAVTPNPWKDAVFLKLTEKKLKFGYYFDDGVSIASPPVKRAIMETVTSLRSQGHEVVEVTPPNVIEAVRIFVALTSHNAYANLREPIKNDPMEPTVKFLLTLSRIPNWLRLFLASIIDNVLRDPVTGSTMRLVSAKSAAQMVSWVARRDTFRQEWNDWLHEQKFDSLIAPVSAIPAAKINATSMLSALATSTLLYNVLDWPVGVVPVTTVCEKEVIEEARWKGREKEGYSWMFLDRIYGKSGAYQDIMKDGVGLPVGIQVVAGPDAGEEGVLAIMKRVSAALMER